MGWAALKPDDDLRFVNFVALGAANRDLNGGAALGMSYRRAWLLVDDMNNCFREPVIAAQVGGSHGGGAALTPFGIKLIEEYRAIEADAHSATAARLDQLEAACKGARATKAAPRRRTIAR